MTLPKLLTAAFLMSISCPIHAQVEIDASWSYPNSSNGNRSGFQGRIVQARKNAGLTATIARGNAHLTDALIEGATDLPYANLVVDTANPAASDGSWDGTTPVDPGGAFAIDGVINFSSDNSGFVIEDGNFSADSHFPGLPGAADDTFTTLDNGQNFSIELLTYLKLPAGETTLGVHHDDAVELALHPNDARDLFRQQIAGFDSNSGKAERTITVNVAEAGLYSARILMAQWNGDATLEFYSVNPADDSLTLINDASTASSIKAWQSLTETGRPYVSSVSPPRNATGVAKDTTIAVSMRNVGSTEPIMKVDGVVVSAAKSTAGEITTFTHTPTATFDSGQTVTVELSYGSATASWSFITLSGSKAVIITGGGQLNGADGWVASRLGSKFGLDVTVIGDDAIQAADASGAVLIFNSSTVNSGKVAGKGLQELAIPIVNVEAGNVDDFFLADAPFTWANGATTDKVEITDATHPINAGLAPGEHQFNTKGIQYHWGAAPQESVVIAHGPGNDSQPTIYAIEAGAEMLDEAGENVVFTHPARRVFFGMTGNDGAATYTEIGEQLFDAAITWALQTPSSNVGVPTISDIALKNTVSVSFTTTSPDSDHVLQRSTDLRNWSVVEGATLTQEDTLYRLSTSKGALPQEHYRVGILAPPALYAEDFESGSNGWVVEQITGTTSWELGTPAVAALSNAHSGSNAYGTDLDGNYTREVNATLTSPFIDLTETRRARLTFWYFVDSDKGNEGVQLRYLDESGATLDTFDTILSGKTEGWTEQSIKLPTSLVGQKIRLQFAFLTDGNDPDGAGFYLDDVMVED